jgi:hypothetical protein
MSVLEKSGRRMTSRLSSLNSRPRREPVPRSRPGHIFPATISDQIAAQWVWTDDYSNIVGAVIRKLNE